MNAEKKSYIRFNIYQRLEHVLIIITFTTLGLTGLPQKYALSPISQAIISGLGGIDVVRIIHRVAATLFLLGAIYHLVMIGYKLIVQQRKAAMLPSVKDAQDALQAFLYNIGIAKHTPKMGRYNFVEKAEYWAMAWGLVVMAITGFMLWNPIATTSIFPGELVPAAKIAHGGEAVLAVLAIILWHFYSVHLKHFNKSMWTGRVSRDIMAEEHAQELEEIETGNIKPTPSAVVQRRRMAIFTPVTAVVSLSLLAGLYYFVSFEKTSVEVIPPAEQVQILVTQTPTIPPTAAPTETSEPTETAQPAGAPPAETPTSGTFFTWDSGAKELFSTKCGTCHKGSGSGGFSINTYDSVMKKINPGDPDNSKVVQVQKVAHPGKFTPDQLNIIIEWIKAGAPQQ